MKSALECYQYAAELKRLAEDAKASEGTRQRLLRTAGEWHQLGLNAERMEKANGDGLRSWFAPSEPQSKPQRPGAVPPVVTQQQQQAQQQHATDKPDPNPKSELGFVSRKLAG